MRRTALLVHILVTLVLSATAISTNPVLGQERQERKGTITGRVTDSSHAVLPGARVELQPRGHAVANDNRGQLNIPNVPAVEYKVTYAHVAYAHFETSFIVTGGEVSRDD